jgi:CheY-like chemotaxis protein
VQLQPDLILRDMERLLARLAGDRSTLVLDLAADLGQVKADRGQLEQVLANLVTNARDAMPNGGTVTITGRNVTLDGETAAALALPVGAYVALAVADTGVGIAAEVRAHIFEPFFSTKARGKGTGLGLASSYGIMRQSNGGIRVDSEVGRGSTFTLYLPRLTTVSIPTPVSVTPMPADSRRGRGETILLVEDEAAVRQVTRRMLVAEGYTVLTAPDAAAARAIVTTHGGEIALLITDVMMPGDSGIELAEGLRQTAPGLDVIFISGYADTECPDGVRSARGNDFVQKPFTGAELLSRVESRLSRRRSRVPSVAHSR